MWQMSLVEVQQTHVKFFHPSAAPLSLIKHFRTFKYWFFCFATLHPVQSTETPNCRQTQFSYVHTAGKFDSSLKFRSDRVSVHTVISKQSDWICVSTHHQHICIDCYGNEVGVKWWCGSAKWKHGDTSSCAPNSHTVRLGCRTSLLYLTNPVTKEAGAHLVFHAASR